jgi:2-oxoglutarate ferredoxin oxidoreductase subunit delta
MAQKGYVEIAIEVCKGCNLCVISCPTECLALNTSDTNSYGLHYSYLAKPEECIGCANCAVMCPDAAITVYRKKKEKAAKPLEGRQ